MQAQTAISGFVDQENTNEWVPKVYLLKMDVDHLKQSGYAQEVAWSSIESDGSFSFHAKHLAHKDAIYRLYIDRVQKIIDDSVAYSPPFIVSNADHMYFEKAAVPLSAYSTTNLADKEWKRLQEFETSLDPIGSIGEDGSQLTKFAKDSLRILIVKLIGIQQLEAKHLLDQDIAKNPDYYLHLLAELKESGMQPSEYKLLERKLAFLTQEAVEHKYARSKSVNIILGILVLGLLLLMYLRPKKMVISADLSKQEKVVQNLILEGKTNKEIANELYISLSTVKTHITNIYGKLKVSSRQELLQKTQN